MFMLLKFNKVAVFVKKNYALFFLYNLFTPIIYLHINNLLPS